MAKVRLSGQVVPYVLVDGEYVYSEFDTETGEATLLMFEGQDPQNYQMFGFEPHCLVKMVVPGSAIPLPQSDD